MTERIELVRGMYFEIEVERDEFAQDPTRDMDMASINVFDDQASFCTFMSGKGWDEAQPLYSDDGAVKAALGGEVLKDYDGNLYMGLEQYSHSGDVLALCRSGNFPDRRWDVSPIVGFISPHLDADSDVIKQYHDLAAEGKVDEAKAVLAKRLNQDIKVYNHYLAGEIYQYNVALYDADDTQIGESDSCCGFIGEEDYCLQEAKDAAWHMALSVLTKKELQNFLEGNHPDELTEFVKYLKNWSLQILSTEEQEDKPLSEIAHRLYCYITNTYLKDADAHTLICRVKESEWSEYDRLPRSDWKYEVLNGDTNLGYWDWVVNQIGSGRLPELSSGELSSQPESTNTREKAKLVRNACVKAYNMDYDEFCAVFGEEAQHGNYLKEKWQLMQRNFSRWFCGLDEESSEKFIAGL